MWVELLENSNTVSEMADTCKQKADLAGKELKKNLKDTLSITRELETFLPYCSAVL